MYLVDTNVISALAPGSPTPPELSIWLHRNTDRLFLSVVTVAEIESGIAKARRTGSGRRADAIAHWLEAFLHLFESRIVPLDTKAARILGAFIDLARGIGSGPGFADLAIAATALSRGHTVLTRNLKHFRDMPVACIDPFATLPMPG